MTIDTDLHFSAQGKALSTGPDVFILETKSENGRGLADRLLRVAGERPAGRCSKYCIGLAATGQVNRYNHFLPTLRRLGLTAAPSRTGHWSALRPDHGAPQLEPAVV